MKKHIYQKLALFIVLTLISTSAAYADTALRTSVPKDVQGTAYEEAVTALMQNDIITGDTDGMFHPDSN